MSSLYDIKEELYECVDKESGEIVDIARFDELQLEFDEKIENIALWHKNLMSDADAYKQEKNAFAEREKKAKAKADSLKNYLDSALRGSKFNTARVEIAYRKSKALDYDGVSEVPEAFLRYSDPTIDKTAVTAAIKSGEVVEGFELVERNNLTIK